MPRPQVPPKYRTRFSYGRRRALVTLRDALTGERRDFHLGEAGTPESRERYARVLAEWEAHGRRLPDAEGQPLKMTSGPTITELCDAFWTAIDGRYSHQQLEHFRATIKILREYYSETRAADFGPKALRVIRNEMIRDGEDARRWTRNYANRQVGLIRQIFRWGVSHEMIPVAVLEALRTVEPLRRGRTDAVEAARVRPVADKLLEGTLPHLNRQVRAVVELQLLTGARPAELLGLRPCDVVTGEHDEVWFVRLDEHKTAHHGRDRTLYFGPQARAVIEPFMNNRVATAYLFSPKEAEMERRYALHASRTTPLSCGNKPGSNKKSSPKKQPSERYTTCSYRRAITYACDAAFPPPEPLGKRDDETDAKYRARLKRLNLIDALDEWRKAHRWHPYQLRHNAATSLRKAFGLEAAQLILGHSSACITDAVYADRDQEKIINIVQEIG